MPENVTHETTRLESRAEWGWQARFGISAAFAGFLAVMAQVSFPVPWTPVPFSLMPFALLVAGAAQRPAWAATSVGIYLLAGAIGIPVFAEGSAGWHHLIGNTAGYLFGFVAVSVFVSWYMQARRALLPRRWLMAVTALLGLVMAAGTAAIVRFNGTGTGFDAYGESYTGWTANDSILWVLGFVTIAGLLLGAVAFMRNRGQGHQAANLFLVMLAAIAILHTLGVLGLIAIGGLAPWTAIILGSLVFLPFDILKAGLAVGLTLPFLPEDRHV